MRISRPIHLLAALALVAMGAVASPAGAAVRPPTWSAMSYLPGVPAGSSAVSQAACTAPGNCVVAGVYPTDNPRTLFVSTEVRGHWGAPRVVVTGYPRTTVGALSCPDAHDCVVVGSYQSANQMSMYGFIASETNGRWGAPQLVTLPGVAPATMSVAGLTAACASAGNCVVGGGNVSGGAAWVESESGGIWGSPDVLGNSVGSGPSAAEYASCGRVGDCTVTGVDGADGYNGIFAVTYSNGQWGAVTQIANVVNSVTTGNGEAAAVNAISCVGVGYCVIGGDYPVDRAPLTIYFQQPFVAVEYNGTWGAAQPVPGVLAVNKGGVGSTTYVRCWTVDQCVIAGFYGDGTFYRPWEERSQGARWGGIIEPQRQGGNASYGLPVGFGCASPAVCAQIGAPGNRAQVGIVNGRLPVSMGVVAGGYSWGGRWTPVRYLGAWTLGYRGWAYVNTVACSPTGIYCLVAGGRNTTASGAPPFRSQRAFVIVFS